MGFEEVPHTADVAIRFWGQDLPELFICAAQGMAWLIAGPEPTESGVEAQVDLTAYDAESLLVTWLSELLYLYERDGMLYTVFELQVTPTHLHGRVRGGPVEQPRLHIKAVTFNELAIRSTERGLEATIVFDV